MRPSVQPFLWICVLFAWEWKIISSSKVEHLIQSPGELGNDLLNNIFITPTSYSFKMRPSVQPFLWICVLFAWEWKIISSSKVEHLIQSPGELGNDLLNNIFITPTSYSFLLPFSSPDLSILSNEFVHSDPILIGYKQPWFQHLNNAHWQLYLNVFYHPLGDLVLYKRKRWK